MTLYLKGRPATEATDAQWAYRVWTVWLRKAQDMKRTMAKPLWLDVVDAVIITAYLAALFAATFMFTGLHPWEIPGAIIDALQACCVLSIPLRYIPR